MESLPEESQSLAHVSGAHEGVWRAHGLGEHLRAVSSLAADFARPFGSSATAGLAGLWHDLGKYRPGFQRYIRQAKGEDAHIEGKVSGPDKTHSTAGALLACDRYGRAGHVLAYLIAGHHAGLYDWNSENTSLEYRLSSDDARKELDEAMAASPASDILNPAPIDLDLRLVPGGSAGFALWLRLLFSCLVDADFLDTEAFMDPDRADRRGDWPDIQSLHDRLDHHLAELALKAPTTLVNHARAEVLAQCRAKAAETPGLFSLTVPTGGGKTLSSMAFALEHARRYGKRRVIYVIPYTSIIEQTADVFRAVFGDAVIEHHSNVESAPEQETGKSRLACENWDAPIVVTTNVQFFESLFAAKTSRCRKLHNIVDSVVVLDEAQLLPPEFLQPILDVLNLLTKHYGVTVVLCTATQPALSTREYFDARQNLRGLDSVREIIDDPDALYHALERVQVRLPADWNTPTSWDALAQELQEHDSALAIVNRRQDARELWEKMPEGTLHLSALMCGAHRSRVIADITARLKANIPTRVVSTQLIEAGVDVDFPVVYRALAGLDSIAQAAGRCNREGKLEQGNVVVFVAPKPAPPGLLRKGEDACRSTLHGIECNPLERDLFARYFERLYHACTLDDHGIADLLKVDGGTLACNFRSAADQFKLIQDEDRVPVIVRYRGPDSTDDKVNNLIAALRTGRPERKLMRKLMRKLQRYIVNIHRREALRLLGNNDLDEIMPGLFVQTRDCSYHPMLGFITDVAPLSASHYVC